MSFSAAIERRLEGGPNAGCAAAQPELARPPEARMERGAPRTRVCFCLSKGRDAALHVSASRGGAVGGAGPLTGADPGALRRELSGLRLKELRARAKEAKVSADDLLDAADSDDPKAATIELLLRAVRAGGR